MAEPRTLAPPHGRYRRGLDGADFSLEANTEHVASDGRFYVLRRDEVVFASEDFEAATQHYHELCRSFWLERLEDEDVQIRIAAAWGLLGLDATDKNAQQVILTYGSAAEKKRLEQAQSRRRALRARMANASARQSSASQSSAGQSSAA